MRKELMGATASLVCLLTALPATLYAQGYYAPAPYYTAPAYQAYAAYPYYPGGFYNVPPGYVAPSMAPGADWGQATASSHPGYPYYNPY